LSSIFLEESSLRIFLLAGGEHIFVITNLTSDAFLHC